MRIGIAGFGRMGELIRNKAIACGHEVGAVIDPFSKHEAVTAAEFSLDSLPLDVIIDFTIPEAVKNNIRLYGQLKVPAVIGTTGWYSDMPEVAEIVGKSGIGLIWSGNFSLGVNIFFSLVKKAGMIMNRFAQYDVMVHEYHHRHKADSPSGTAAMLGDILLSTLDRKESILDRTPAGVIKETELHISSTRGGEIPGTHRVIFDSEEDSLIIEHSARSRSGFADGALMAAEWIKDRKGFYNLEDMIQSLIGGGDN